MLNLTRGAKVVMPNYAAMYSRGQTVLKRSNSQLYLVVPQKRGVPQLEDMEIVDSLEKATRRRTTTKPKQPQIEIEDSTDLPFRRLDLLGCITTSPQHRLVPPKALEAILSQRCPKQSFLRYSCPLPPHCTTNKVPLELKL